MKGRGGRQVSDCSFESGLAYLGERRSIRPVEDRGAHIVVKGRTFLAGRGWGGFCI